MVLTTSRPSKIRTRLIIKMKLTWLRLIQKGNIEVKVVEVAEADGGREEVVLIDGSIQGSVFNAQTDTNVASSVEL